MAVAAPPPSAEEGSDESIGRSLAIQQMLQRSASAAANAKRIESERGAILKQKQSEAVARALSESRRARSQPLQQAAPASLPPKTASAQATPAVARRAEAAKASPLFNISPKPPAAAAPPPPASPPPPPQPPGAPPTAGGPSGSARPAALPALCLPC